MTEDEKQVVRELEQKLAAMNREDVESWLFFSRVGQGLFALLGVTLCLIMLAYPDFFVILPSAVLIYLFAQFSSVLSGIRGLCQQRLNRDS